VGAPLLRKINRKRREGFTFVEEGKLYLKILNKSTAMHLKHRLPEKVGWKTIEQFDPCRDMDNIQFLTV
jgi:hypothetical protein